MARMARDKIRMEKWKFRLDREGLGMSGKWYHTGLQNAREVTVPHTWNIEADSQDFCGTGWYEYIFYAPQEWKAKKAAIYFHAVYHDAVVWANGTKVGGHHGSGYTPFSVALDGDILRYGESNRITVYVNNEYAEEMLPVMRNSDWANDGGIIRDAEIIITGRNSIKLAKVYSFPELGSKRERQDKADAKIKLDILSDLEDKGTRLHWQLFEGIEENRTLLLEGCEELLSERMEIQIKDLKNIKLWHFDAPNLYTMRLVLEKGTESEDELFITFGFKQFKVVRNQFILNGEQVRLCGTEWMPGSDPSFGMAETKEQISKMLTILKESNCVFTRFHWQQDEFVYDWCDKNGILVQEEVPFWGQLIPTQEHYTLFEQQAREMIDAHFNHPSVISWGVGNELKAQEDKCAEYVKRAIDFCHVYDCTRPANYVSCTMFQDPVKDAMGLSDMMMANEYIGTWNAGLDQYKDVERIVSANKDKPVVISEFGLCEPAFSGGDERRNRIFLEKMETYRKFPSIAGTIYFCLNDYRTQIGETGEGKKKRRIHGSTGLCGEHKPSYQSVAKECAPFSVKAEDGKVILRCQDTLPCYMMKDYSADVESLQGEVLAQIGLPDLQPGESTEIKLPENAGLIRIFRPNGSGCGIIRI